MSGWATRRPWIPRRNHGRPPHRPRDAHTMHQWQAQALAASAEPPTPICNSNQDSELPPEDAED